MNWSVYVEYGTPEANLTDDTIDALMTELAPHHTAIGPSPTGNLSFQLTIQAPTAETASRAALTFTASAVAATLGQVPVTGIEIHTSAEHERRHRHPEVPELAGRQDVAHILQVTPNRADQIIATARFQRHVPPAAAVSGRPVYLAADVRRFAENVRNTPPKEQQ